jgi:hypothetical protein
MVSACGGGTGEGAQAPQPNPSPTPAPLVTTSPPGPSTGSTREPTNPQATHTLSGTLGGSASLEGGCAWLETEQDRIQVRYPEGYRVAFDPLRLLGPDGAVVAREGEQVTITGSPAQALLTVCQVGELWQADEVG